MNSIRFKNPNKASLNIIGVLRERERERESETRYVLLKYLILDP